MHRPKRIISKPTRYQTTSSSDESPNKKKRCASSIDKDISEIRQILEEDITEDYSSTHINIQYPAINTQASIQPQINNEPCLNNGIPSDTQVTHVPASFCNIRSCIQQAEPRQIINNEETLTQLRSNAETWTAQNNYENYRHHDTFVANEQVNLQYPSGNLQVQSEKRNSGYGKQC